MRTIRLWQGIRMRQAMAARDPDAPGRLVTLPAAWDDAAAEALAALVPGDGDVSVAAASAIWLGVIAQRARQAGLSGDIVLGLHGLLRRRQAAPSGSVWRADPAEPPGFFLNLGAFHDPARGFDLAGFVLACRLTACACRLLAPDAPSYALGLTGLDDLLAALGLDYDSRAARDTAACLAALLRAEAALALESDQRDLLAAGADWPSPPARAAIPGLAEEARAARAKVNLAPGAPVCTGVFGPDRAEALLGVETCGVAPAFAPVRAGRLSRASQDRLAASGLSPEAALVASLQGDDPLPVAPGDAHGAMHDAVRPFLHTMPARPLPVPDRAIGAALPLRTPKARALPSRHSGVTQKASVGGHRIFLRTGEYDDGNLGEITIALPKEGEAFRGLMECFCQAVSIGLQHGVKLDSFVDAFTLTQFGPGGAVEGDPAVGQATSLLDYVFRNLSVNYLGRPLPELEPAQFVNDADDAAPLLPLHLPRGTSPRVRRRSLRVVA
jgi:ribonucleoside-diphosphate reductase alpha chain